MVSEEYKEMERAALALQALLGTRLAQQGALGNRGLATQRANGIDSRTLVSGATEGCAHPRSAVGTGLIASTKDDYRTEPGVAGCHQAVLTAEENDRAWAEHWGRLRIPPLVVDDGRRLTDDQLRDAIAIVRQFTADAKARLKADDGSAAREPEPRELIEKATTHMEHWRDGFVDWLNIPALGDDETTTASSDTSPDGVKAHIEQTIDHLQNHRVSPDQRRDLRKATEQAERTNNKSDAAIGNVIGRALR